MDWQLIETLPFDSERWKTGFYLYVIFFDGEKVTVGFEHDRGDYYDALAWDYRGEHEPILPAPTHWMPLPPPPTVSNNG